MVFRMQSLRRWRAGAQIMQRKIPGSTNQFFVPTVITSTRMFLPLALQLRNTQGKGRYLHLSLSASGTFLYPRTTVRVLDIAALTGRVATATIKIRTFLIIPKIRHHERLPSSKTKRNLPRLRRRPAILTGAKPRRIIGLRAYLRVRQNRLGQRDPRVSSTGV
jgi:hypothetical protein